jgi:hypothetical protein
MKLKTGPLSLDSSQSLPVPLLLLLLLLLLPEASG